MAIPAARPDCVRIRHRLPVCPFVSLRPIMVDAVVCPGGLGIACFINLFSVIPHLVSKTKTNELQIACPGFPIILLPSLPSSNNVK
jgi:hypothetical protein